MMTRAALIPCLTLALAIPALPARAAAPELNDDLRQAAMKGDLEAVKTLLAKGAEVDAATEFGATALIFAADRGHTEVVKALLDKGADVNRKDVTYQSSPITWAAYNGHAAVVALLLERGATDAAGTLEFAIDRDHLEVVKTVLASGKVPRESLGSALSAARQEGKTEIVDLLVKAGAVPLPSAGSVYPADTLATYGGTYHSEAGGPDLSVSIEGERLLLARPGQPPLELSPKEGGLFQLVGAGPVTVTFNVDAGQVVGLTVKPPDAGRVFKKVPTTPPPAAAPPASPGEPARKEGSR